MVRAMLCAAIPTVDLMVSQTQAGYGKVLHFAEVPYERVLQVLCDGFLLCCFVVGRMDEQPILIVLAVTAANEMCRIATPFGVAHQVADDQIVRDVMLTRHDPSEPCIRTVSPSKSYRP